jgi:3-hydroxyacyl-CoA dehydrogenase
METVDSTRAFVRDVKRIVVKVTTDPSFVRNHLLLSALPHIPLFLSRPYGW